MFSQRCNFEGHSPLTYMDLSDVQGEMLSRCLCCSVKNRRPIQDVPPPPTWQPYSHLNEAGHPDPEFPIGSPTQSAKYTTMQWQTREMNERLLQPVGQSAQLSQSQRIRQPDAQTSQYAVRIPSRNQPDEWPLPRTAAVYILHMMPTSCSGADALHIGHRS
ncbi:uncharacterized protein LOC135376808 isoform X1 [Ornithodoros turicata]|uniref:uncharacterized protein LOC135376808 isoform X1 n=2 Tax=Ornithodoros turicata TaxID=34597 RepID=UPI0031388679